MQVLLIRPLKCTQIYPLFSISTATSIMQATGVSNELAFLNRSYPSSFSKHHNVLYLFRISSKFFHMASEVLCILDLDYFPDLKHCSLHPTWGTNSSFYSSNPPNSYLLGSPGTSYSLAWKTRVPILNDRLFLLINFKLNFYLLKGPFPNLPNAVSSPSPVTFVTQSCLFSKYYLYYLNLFHLLVQYQSHPLWGNIHIKRNSASLVHCYTRERDDSWIYKFLNLLERRRKGWKQRRKD